MKSIFTLLSFWFIALAGGNQVYAETQLLDYIKIIVNNEIFTNIELQETTESVRRQIEQSLPAGAKRDQQLANLEEDVLQNVIDDLLLISRAKELKIEVSDREIDQRVDKLEADNPQIVEAYLPEVLRELIAKDFLKQRLLNQEVNTKINIPDKEIANHCSNLKEETKEIELAQIMFRASEQDAREKADIVRQAFDSGAPFEQLAKDYSEDPSSQGNGGIIGKFQKGQLLREIEEVVFAMEENTLSELVKTSMGYHLFYINEVVDGKGDDCENLSDTLYNQYYEQIFQEKHQKALRVYLDGLRKNARVIIKEE